MATLEAQYVYGMKNWAAVGDQVLVAEDGEVSTRKEVEQNNDGADFSLLVDTLDEPVDIEVDDSVYEYAENLSELIESVVDAYEKNPPKTFEEELDYEYNDDDPNEWVEYYEEMNFPK